MALIGVALLLFVLWKLKPYPRGVEPDGGFCAYEEDYYPAEVIAIEKVQENPAAYEVLFKVWWDEMYSDTLYYSMEFNDYLSDTALQRLDCRLGKYYQYEHSRITEGSCNPDIFRLIMLPFEGSVKDFRDTSGREAF